MGAHRADFTSAKHSRKSVAGHKGRKRPGVMVWCVKEILAATVTGEKKGPVTGRNAGGEEIKVLVSRVGIAYLKLNGAPHRHLITYRDHTTFLVCAKDRTNEKVTSTEIAAMFINHATNVEPRSG